MYLVRKSKPRVKHVWLGNNTACKMWATGGLRKSKYHLVTDKMAESLEVCTMCQNNSEKSASGVLSPVDIKQMP